MPRTNRITPGGWVFHVLNRANAGMQIFDKADDYRAFESVLHETVEQFQMRLLSYSVMPNHWHMVLWPREDSDLGRFMHRLTVTHVRRWHLYRQTVGMGHVYQGIYKSFPIQQDDHFLTVCRYVERNALKAKLVERAEDWQWSSFATRQMSPAKREAEGKPALADWPVDIPRGWGRLVEKPMTQAETQSLSVSVNRGQPYGSDRWQKQAAARLSLESTMRPRGRPVKKKAN